MTKEPDCIELGCTENDQRNCTELGTCKLHGIEVERRRGLEILTSEIPKLLTAFNRLSGKIIVYITLGSVIVGASFAFATASFLYTKSEAKEAAIRSQANRDRSDHADREFEITLNKLVYQVSSLASSVNKTEERHDELVNQLLELNRNLSTSHRK